MSQPNYLVQKGRMPQFDLSWKDAKTRQFVLPIHVVAPIPHTDNCVSTQWFLYSHNISTTLPAQCTMKANHSRCHHIFHRCKCPSSLCVRFCQFLRVENCEVTITRHIQLIQLITTHVANRSFWEAVGANSFSANSLLDCRNDSNCLLRTNCVEQCRRWAESVEGNYSDLDFDELFNVNLLMWDLRQLSRKFSSTTTFGRRLIWLEHWRIWKK